ncbi:MAG: CapA family protein [Phycisphaerae bacterium]
MAGRSVVFGAVGDIDLSRASADAIKANGHDWPFARLMPALADADVLFGNLESVVLPAGYPDAQIDPQGLVSKFDGTPVLKAARFDIINLAQNHILDGGRVGMFHTRRLVEGLGIPTAGIGRTQREARRMVVVERGGLRLGFLCYCEDTNYSLSTAGPCHAYYELPAVLEDVRRCRGKVDVLVVSIHADLEFMETPSTPRREGFRRIARAGATLVLGHHPHVPQGVERIGDSLVAYSLGNCFFRAHSMNYMRGNLPHTGHSFILLAEVARRRVKSFKRIPFAIAKPPDERPVPLEGAERRKMLAYLSKLDCDVRNDRTVAANWRAKALRMLDAYIEKFRKTDREEMLHDWLGRLGLVAENRGWVGEVMNVVCENWARQAATQDPLHRPHYALTNRKREKT